MNTFAIGPDGSLVHMSRIDADALDDYTMELPTATGDLFGGTDAHTPERWSGFRAAPSRERAYDDWMA